jgi:hypothetical protein
VGKKSFALVWNDRVVLKLDTAHQELLFEIRPETFQPIKVATGHWSYVEIAHLAETELALLVREAWARVVPKSVSRAHLSQLSS